MQQDPENQTELIQPEKEAEKVIETTENETPVAIFAGEEEPVGVPEFDVLQELLDDEDSFEQQIKTASPLEMVVLLEKIDSLEDIRQHLSKVSMLKKRFDKLTKTESGDAGEDPQLVSRFNTALGRFNRKRTRLKEELEKERTANSAIKAELLDQLREIVAKEDVNSLNAVRQIQEKWRNTGWILSDDVVSFNTQYKHFLDIFYNLRSQMHDLLDIDRKYNLEEKQRIIEELNSLVPETYALPRDTWKERTERVNDLHELWKTVGPVPKENNDEINEGFKNAVERFFNLRQAYYGSQEAERKVNAAKKTALLETLKTHTTFLGKSAKEWNEETEKVLALQKQFLEIGDAPKEENKVLWKAYRKLCDTFFENKSDFFKGFGEERNKNLELKIALCEKAEALKESKDWKKTADELKKMQNEWRKIGAVNEKDSQKVWKRFRKACDHFFNQREIEIQGTLEEQKANLEVKKAIIEELVALTGQKLNAKAALEALSPIKQKWSETGHVPFKNKDKIQEIWKKALDEFFDQPNLKGESMAEIRLEASLGSIADEGQKERQIKDEMRKLQKQMEAIQKDYDAYSTNIQIISKGKSGDSLRAMIQKKIDDEGAKIEKIQGKLKLLRKLLKESGV